MRWLEMIRDQFRRFADERVAPFAHGWHLKDELIPMEIIEALAKGDLKLGAVLMHMDSSEVDDWLEERLGWSEVYRQA